MENMSSAIAVFLISSLFVILAGVALARYGDALAEKTGWGTLWVGTILVSVSTSLPELSINISAVWLEESPGLALGNVFGANMINLFVISIVALIFGIRNIFGHQAKGTQILVKVGLILVVLSAVVAISGDASLGPSSLGGLFIAITYITGMRWVYNAGRAEAKSAAAENPAPKGSARKDWIGFGIASLVVIIAGRFLAASADTIAELSGIGASFIGVLLVSLVTTLPEGSVTIAAAFRKSYGIAIGNVYGSCAFNVFIITLADLFSKTPLLRAMEGAHYVAATGAFILMGLGLLVIRDSRSNTLRLGRIVTPAIPVLYVIMLFWVYHLAQG